MKHFFFFRASFDADCSAWNTMSFFDPAFPLWTRYGWIGFNEGRNGRSLCQRWKHDRQTRCTCTLFHPHHNRLGRRLLPRVTVSEDTKTNGCHGCMDTDSFVCVSLWFILNGRWHSYIMSEHNKRGMALIEQNWWLPSTWLNQSLCGR